MQLVSGVSRPLRSRKLARFRRKPGTDIRGGTIARLPATAQGPRRFGAHHALARRISRGAKAGFSRVLTAFARRSCDPQDRTGPSPRRRRGSGPACGEPHAVRIRRSFANEQPTARPHPRACPRHAALAARSEFPTASRSGLAAGCFLVSGSRRARGGAETAEKRGSHEGSKTRSCFSCGEAAFKLSGAAPEIDAPAARTHAASSCLRVFV